MATGCCWLVVESILEYWFVLDMMCLRRILVVSIAKYWSALVLSGEYLWPVVIMGVSA